MQTYYCIQVNVKLRIYLFINHKNYSKHTALIIMKFEKQLSFVDSHQC